MNLAVDIDGVLADFASAVFGVAGVPLARMNEVVGYDFSPVLARVFVLSCIFGMWTLKPDLVDQLAKAGAENLQPGMIRTVLEKITFPLNVFTGGICGYLIDSIAEKVPFLSRELPSTNGTIIQQGG